MKYVYLILILFLFMCCKGQQPKQSLDEEPKTEHANLPSFQMVTIPSIITDPTERAEYLIKHYWDHFDFTDTTYIHHPEISEQAFVDYIDVMPHAPYSSVSSSIKNMLKKAEADSSMFTFFTGLYEKYLYDPNSPLRNDEFYIPALEVIIASPLTIEKVRPSHLLEVAKRNRVGEKASDFTYTLVDGRQSTLYKIQSDYTLLFFNNPGCNSCKEITGQIQSSLTAGYLMKEKKLTVLAVYTDEDLTEWKNYLSDIPKEWINSYDKGTRLLDQEIYDLKAIPTLYLLDKDKKVILKDTTFEQLEHYLRQLTN